MSTEAVGRRVDAVRAFNRSYTALLGLLEGEHLHTPYTLTEARVLFEAAQSDRLDLRDLRETLHLDPGYLTRIVGRFVERGLLGRERSATDARRQVVWLTERGRQEFETLNARSAEQIGDLLGRLPEPDQHRLVDAMGTVRDLLSGRDRPAGYVLRDLEPGDLGWVVSRNGALYAAEYGFDDSYEALVARLVADYVEHRDPSRERGWIAELSGTPVGCVFCVRADRSAATAGTATGVATTASGTVATGIAATASIAEIATAVAGAAEIATAVAGAADTAADTAKLRLLLVEPSARGLGIGARLVDECLRYARQAGYRRITLWTNDILTSARRIYQRAGFTLDDSAPHHSFGRDLVGENWSRDL